MEKKSNQYILKKVKDFFTINIKPKIITNLEFEKNR